MAANEQFDVLIVGAGPAGMAAACAAQLGSHRQASICVVDDNPAAGGQIWRGAKAPAGDRHAAHLLRRYKQLPIARRHRTTIVAAPEAGVLLAECDGAAIELVYKKLILATGAREFFLPFSGWTLPNIVGAGGLQAMMKSGMPVEGKQVVVAGSGPLLLAVAAAAKRAGADVPLVAEQAARRRVAAFALRLLQLHPEKLWQGAAYRWAIRGARYLTGCWPTAAHGCGKIEAVTLRCGGRTWTEPCDILACGFGLVPNLELPRLLGCVIRDGVVAVNELQESSLPGVYCAGEITGLGGAEAAMNQGTAAGFAAVGRPEMAKRQSGLRWKERNFAEALRSAFALRPELRELPDDDTFICRCEDVTRRQLQGYSSWREAKLHTRCGMGRCQGRVCGAAVEFMLGWRNESVRVPILPATIATLAGANIASAECPDETQRIETRLP